MNLYCETIFDFYTIKRKKFLCQIKVSPKSRRFKNTCRCLSQEQWAIFDNKLEKYLSAKNILDDNDYRFNLNPLIEVKVRKSKLSYKYFYELLYTIGENRNDGVDVTEKDLVLECLIDFQQEVPSSSSVAAQEYEPEVCISPNTTICCPMPYEPYTPGKEALEEFKIKTIKNNDINDHKSDEDTYSPKPILQEGANISHLTTLIPQYTPAPINEKKKCKENSKLNPHKTTADEKKFLNEHSNKQYRKTECEYIPKGQLDTKHNAPIYIPTPIEEITQQLCDRDNKKTLRKRSNTIDVFSEFSNENDKEKIMTKPTQQINNRNTRRSAQKNLKKRSMTIDEMPSEILDMRVHIPSYLNQNIVQNEVQSSNYMQLNANIEDVRNSDKKVPIMLINGTTCTAAKLESSKEAGQNITCSIIAEGENSASNITKVQGVQSPLNMVQKSKENKSILTTLREVERDLVNPCKDLQLSNHHTANRVFRTTVEKNSLSDKKLNNLQAKLLSNDNNFALDKHFKRIPETQRKENDVKPELYNGNDKCVRDKRLHDHVFTKNVSVQSSLKRDGKIENHCTPLHKKCKRLEKSPDKLKKLTDEQYDSLNSKKHKCSLKNKELFGTDDEDDDDSFCKNINNKNVFTLKESSASQDLNASTSSKKKKKLNKEILK